MCIADMGYRYRCSMDVSVFRRTSAKVCVSMCVCVTILYWFIWLTRCTHMPINAHTPMQSALPLPTRTMTTQVDADMFVLHLRQRLHQQAVKFGLPTRLSQLYTHTLSHVYAHTLNKPLRSYTQTYAHTRTHTHTHSLSLSLSLSFTRNTHTPMH